MQAWSDFVDASRRAALPGFPVSTMASAALPFACVPSFFVVLRAFLPAFQASVIYQYRCGQIRSHWCSSRYDFNSAGLRARYLHFPFSLFSRAAKAFSPSPSCWTCPLSPRDSRVASSTRSSRSATPTFSATCSSVPLFPRFHAGCSYLEAWFRALRARALSSLFPGLRLPAAPAELRALRTLETFVRLELRQRAGEASVYRRQGGVEGFSRLHAEESLIVSGLAQNEGEAVAAWEELVRQDCVRQGSDGGGG